MARRLADARARRRVIVAGTITSAVMDTWRGMPAQMCCVDDGTGRITVVFGGVRPVPGVVPGTRLHVEGTALADDASLVLWNPSYEFEQAAGEGPAALRLVGRPQTRPRTHADAG